MPPLQSLYEAFTEMEPFPYDTISLYSGGSGPLGANPGTAPERRSAPLASFFDVHQDVVSPGPRQVVDRRQSPARAQGHTLHRILRRKTVDPRLLCNQLGQTPQKGAAPRQDNPSVYDIGRKLRLSYCFIVVILYIRCKFILHI